MPKNNNLAENFHWQIMMARRNKAISQRKLAEVIGESETSIKMIEQGELPQNSDKLISKIEQYLRINLRKNTNQQNSQIGIAQNQKIEEQNPPARIIKYDEKALKNITISDLVKMKKEKQEQALAEKPGQKDSIEVINLDDEL
jgi:ribosome-binding protein aMBF1 (putative translation factor)